MTEIYLEYNPYKVETIFKMDGMEVSGKFESVKKQRIQTWLDKKPGWDGLAKELEKLTNDTEITIQFKGRKIDFEDLESYIKSYSGDIVFTLAKPQIVKNDKNVLCELGHIIEECSKGPIPELKDPAIKKTYEIVKNSTFTVSVIATMSSGKSTLINALLGQELLPSQNEACTATIARITDNDGAKTFIAQCRDKNENAIGQAQEATLELLNQFNSDEKVTYIDINGDIPYIGSQNMALILQDTPGPNNSQNEHHEELTDSIISDRNNSVVLYVMNATQFAIKDDESLLRQISAAMQRGGKQSRDRFIFVVNKCDDGFDPEKGETIDKLLISVREYLKKFDIQEPNLFPTSAKMALLIRKKKSGKYLTRQENKELEFNIEPFNDFKECHFETLATLSPSCRIKVEDALQKAEQDGNKDEQALIHTGIPALEAAINEYLDKYAYPIKINDAIQQASGIIEEKDMKAKFEKSIASDSKRLAEVRKGLEITSQKHELGKQRSEEYKKKIDEFHIDGQESVTWHENVEKSLAEIMELLPHEKEVEKIEAEKLLNKFQDSVKGYEKKLQTELRLWINTEVINQGEQILSQYNQSILEIQNDLAIPGYNFEKVQEFQSHKFNDLDDIIKQNTSSKDIYDKQKVKNYNRHWYTFWRPKYVFEDKVVDKKEMVNVEEIRRSEFVNVSSTCKKNIDNAFKQASTNVQDFKKFFTEQIDKLNQTIDKILQEIDEQTKNEIEINKRVNDNQEKSKWLSNIVDKLNAVMDF